MAKDLRTAGEVATHLKLNMPNLEQAVAYWTDADGKLGKGADHTEIFRYAEMLAEKACDLIAPAWNRRLDRAFDTHRTRNYISLHLGPLAPPPGGDRRGPHRTTQHSFQCSASRSSERVRHFPTRLKRQ